MIRARVPYSVHPMIPLTILMSSLFLNLTCDMTPWYEHIISVGLDPYAISENAGISYFSEQIQIRQTVVSHQVPGVRCCAGFGSPDIIHTFAIGISSISLPELSRVSLFSNEFTASQKNPQCPASCRWSGTIARLFRYGRIISNVFQCPDLQHHIYKRNIKPLMLLDLFFGSISSRRHDKGKNTTLIGGETYKYMYCIDAVSKKETVGEEEKRSGNES